MSEGFPNIENKNKEISSPILFDLYRNANDMSRYYVDKNNINLDSIKSTAIHIKQELFKLGVTKLPLDSKLSEAYLSACKINESFNDFEQAGSAMERIASLLITSNGFQESSEKWKAERNK